jgi:hypothetical protein
MNMLHVSAGEYVCAREIKPEGEDCRGGVEDNDIPSEVYRPKSASMYSRKRLD